ncbi:MAG: hypothetical protein NUV35_00510 [Syntrophomonadaceae bacterium]|nr:hypothetical protein [Syntrophomonadaceae bacterium]
MSPGLALAGIALLGALAQVLMLRLMLPMLRQAGVLRPNYQGRVVPVAAGLTFPAALLPSYTAALLAGLAPPAELAVATAVVAAMCLLGLVDDLLGDRSVLGFRGHLGRLARGELTTGGLKALGGGVVALFAAAALSEGWPDLVVNALLVALATNLVNLLDLRPGRAAKGFLLCCALLVVPASAHLAVVLPLAAAVLVYFPVDVRARAMMGDAGSNVLGAVLGLACVLGLGWQARLAVLAALVMVHLLAETVSLSAIIERVGVLRFLDNLGRGGQ